MLHAVARATVPKVTVVMRKAYGAGYYVMSGRAYEPDLIVAWPSAEISVMGAEGAVEIVMRKQVEEAEDPEAKQAELIEAYRKIIDVYIAAGNGHDRRRDRPARDARRRSAARSRWRQTSGSSGPGRSTGWCRSDGRDVERQRRDEVACQPVHHAARDAAPRRWAPSGNASPRMLSAVEPVLAAPGQNAASDVKEAAPVAIPSSVRRDLGDVRPYRIRRAH